MYGLQDIVTGILQGGLSIVRNLRLSGIVYNVVVIQDMKMYKYPYYVIRKPNMIIAPSYRSFYVRLSDSIERYL